MVARSNSKKAKYECDYGGEDMVVLQMAGRKVVRNWRETTKWREKGMDFVPIVSKDLKDTSPFS